MSNTYKKMGCFIIFLASICFSLAAYSQDTLSVLAWPGYADPDLVNIFEQRHQVKVDVTLVESDDIMWKRLNESNGDKFDVFAVNTAQLQRYIDKGISIPLTLSNIPNSQKQLPRFSDLSSIPGLIRNGKVYAIPYTYSEMGLIYDLNEFSQPPDSFSVMWDKRYQGRVLMYAGSEHNFSFAALSLGLKNPFQIPNSEFGLVTKQVIALRRNILTYYEKPEDATLLFNENHIALMFANYGSQQVKMLKETRANIGYVIPKEGALAWLDCWSVTRDAKNKKLAEDWINFLLEQKVSHALSERQGLANTLEEPEGLTGSDKLIWLERVENMDKRKLLWDRIISGDVQEEF
ncbi:extracellular solute-binding protein [Shewanella glacialimarina]|uniref:extracellular solute-binding protein n=1 Tax=Shewanella glacialimarina TaxID=2590884 RepID=UPI001CF83B65|nr:extracellular solute-binding protein [Shewanella glacialimarina]